MLLFEIDQWSDELGMKIRGNETIFFTLFWSTYHESDR